MQMRTLVVLLTASQALSLSVTPLTHAVKKAPRQTQKALNKADIKKSKEEKAKAALEEHERIRRQAEREARETLNIPTNYTAHLAPISATNPMECPTMPDSPAAWEQSFFWAVFIDGKDARKGPHVYDWDRSFFFKVSGTLSDIYAAEKTEEGRQPLSLDLIKKYRMATYGDELYNMVCRGHHTGARVPLTEDWEEKMRSGKWQCDNGKGGSDIMPKCTDRMECKDITALLANIPEYLYTYEAKRGDGCYRGLEAYSANATKAHALERLVEGYNIEIAGLQANLFNSASKEDLLDAVVKFARAFAFLHPFKNGNGRLRNILVQREVRRLGIGCGMMMYNYNKDAFVDGFDRYVSKVREGLDMFSTGWDAKANPWLDREKTNDHVKKFETLSGLEKCAEEDNIGSGGSINLDYTKRRKPQDYTRTPPAGDDALAVDQ